MMQSCQSNLTPLLGRGRHTLLEMGERPAAGQSGLESEEKQAGNDARSGALICAVCRQVITAKDYKTVVNGTFEHTFANPAGFIHRIGCFQRAPGCFVDREETAAFTWFAGFAWALSVCASCSIHLGWRFKSENQTFFGLILERLIEKGQRST